MSVSSRLSGRTCSTNLEHASNSSHARRSGAAEPGERGFELGDGHQPLAQRRFERLLPLAIVDIGRQVDERLQPVGTTDPIDHDGAFCRERAPAQRSVIGRTDSVKSVHDRGEPTAGDAAGREHSCARPVELVGIVRAVGVDLAGDTPPPSSTLAPPEGLARQPRSRRLPRREQPSHHRSPRSARWDGGETVEFRADHHHPGA
jgi:hypothetical protein